MLQHLLKQHVNIVEAEALLEFLCLPSCYSLNRNYCFKYLIKPLCDIENNQCFVT